MMIFNDMRPSSSRGCSRPGTRLIPAFALLIAAFCLFPASTAQAQVPRTVLTNLSLSYGGTTVPLGRCVNGNSSCNVTVPRDVTSVTVTPTWNGDPSTASVGSYELYSGDEITAEQSVASGNSVSVTLASGLRFNSAGTEHRTMVTLSLETSPSVARNYGMIIYKGGPINVSLSASTNSVTEPDATAAAKVTVTATLSAPWDGNRDVSIPLTGTHGTSEAGDWVFESTYIGIKRGESTGTTRIFVWPDADSDNETMTVGLGTLPTGQRPGATNTRLTAGTPSSVEITITDNDVQGNEGQGAGGDQVSGSGGRGQAPNNNLPAQDPPAQDPPAQDPPAQDPPAQDPPAQDPPAQDPPAQDPPPNSGKVGDFNDDGSVDLLDYDLFVQFWDTKKGEAGYDEKYDLDGDGVVALGDYSIFVENWGK